MLAEGQRPSEALDHEIRAFARTRLARHEYPRAIKFSTSHMILGGPGSTSFAHFCTTSLRCQRIRVSGVTVVSSRISALRPIAFASVQGAPVRISKPNSLAAEPIRQDSNGDKDLHIRGVCPRVSAEFLDTTGSTCCLGPGDFARNDNA